MTASVRKVRRRALQRHGLQHADAWGFARAMRRAARRMVAGGPAGGIGHLFLGGLGQGWLGLGGLAGVDLPRLLLRPGPAVPGWAMAAVAVGGGAFLRACGGRGEPGAIPVRVDWEDALAAGDADRAAACLVEQVRATRNAPVTGPSQGLPYGYESSAKKR